MCRPTVTAIDYAHALRDLSDTHFPDAAKIVLVQDNLSTHKPASLYEAFPASEALRLAERFEWHYTPKHGSWLDMDESERGVLSTQCLDRRIPDKQTRKSATDATSSGRPSRPGMVLPNMSSVGFPALRVHQATRPYTALR
jgi:hypothetical protein